MSGEGKSFRGLETCRSVTAAGVVHAERLLIKSNSLFKLDPIGRPCKYRDISLKYVECIDCSRSRGPSENSDLVNYGKNKVEGVVANKVMLPIASIGVFP
jgi:hypothetical protein